MAQEYQYDYLVVGAGFFGSIFAHELTKAGKKVLVIDKRDHIGGNCYSKEIERIQVHMYGSHIFHCDEKAIWEYVNQFVEFSPFVNRVKANCDGRIFSFPINLLTLYQLWGVRTPEDAKRKLDEIRVKNPSPKNAEEWILSQVGQEILDLFYKGYTEKHWQRPLNELPISIYKRIPIRLNFDDNYYFHKYQGIPKGGYTALFKKMLQGIEVRLNTNFFENREYYERICRKIVYTGPIDQFFDYQFGKLEYRSIRIEMKIYDVNDFQGCAVVTHPMQNVPYTKTVEHKHFDYAESGRTVVTYEYPLPVGESQEPYYPLNDAKNEQILAKYLALATEQKRYVFGGRLADFKYYDMNQVVQIALERVKKELKV